MSETKIEWTDVTWNPTRGCSRKSPGCDHCFAMREARRHDHPGGAYEGLTRVGSRGVDWAGTVRLVPEKLDEPLRWRKPLRVFVNSMSDLFHPSLPDEAIDRVFAVMALAPRHTFQILTKRPTRMRRYMTGANANGDGVACRIATASKSQSTSIRPFALPSENVFEAARVARGEPWRFVSVAWPLPNVWLGVSVEDQKNWDERVPQLEQTPAAVRFVSLEPLLGAVDMHLPHRDEDGQCSRCGEAFAPEAEELPAGHRCPPGFGPRVDQVILGGESGPGARPSDVEWIRSGVRQCRAAGVAPFVKQLGARVVCDLSDANRAWFLDHLLGHEIRDQRAAVHLKGRKGGDPAEWPEDLRAREYPRV